MNTSNYGIKSDHNLRKSFILETYHSQVLPSNQNTPNLIKRSSFNQNQNYPPVVDHPKTPKAVPFQMEGLQVSNQYYHQSNYSHNTYKSQQYQPPSHVSLNRIQAFNLQEKRTKQNQMEDLIKQLSQKLDKTINQVQKHQLTLKNMENSSNVSHLQPQALAKIITETVNDRLKVQQIQTKMQFSNYKTQVQQLKEQMEKYIQKAEVEDRIKKIGININKAIQQVRQGLVSNLAEMSDSQTKTRKKQIQKIKTHLQEQINNLEKGFGEKLKKQKEDWDLLTQSSSIETISSKKVFLGDPILVKVGTKIGITIKGMSKQIEQAETVYKIDAEGYLLDWENKYILNSKYEQIKLSGDQMQLLREKGFLR